MMNEILSGAPGVYPVGAQDHLFPAMQAANYSRLPLNFISVQICSRFSQVPRDHNRRHVRDGGVSGKLSDHRLFISEM